MKYKIFWLLILLPTISFAADSSTIGGQLDDLIALFQKTSITWVSPMQLIAVQIFAIVFIPETAWLLIKSFLENNYGRMWTLLGIRIVTAGFFMYWIQHPEIFHGIIQFFAQAGAKASGFTFTPDGTFTLKPSMIINYYQTIDNSVSKALETAGLTDIGVIFSVSIQLLITEFALIIIALILTVTLLEANIVICGGIALLGFAGSNWTISYFQSYLKYAIGIAIKFMVICLLMGMFQHILQTQIDQFTHVCHDGVCPIREVGHAFGQTLVLVVVITYLAYKVPEMASSMLSGTLNMNFAGLLAAASGVMAGSKVGAGAAGSAIGAAGKVISAGTALATGKGAGELIKSGLKTLSNKLTGSTPTDEIGSGGSTSSMKDKLGLAGENLKAAGGHAKSSFGKMANAAQHGKNMSADLGRGGGVNTGAGPNIGHGK